MNENAQVWKQEIIFMTKHKLQWKLNKSNNWNYKIKFKLRNIKVN